MTPRTREEQAHALWQAYIRSTRRPAPRVAHVLEGRPRSDVTLADGSRIATWRVGEGPAILLLHGIGDDHTIWQPLMHALIGRRRAFVAIDLPAHGLSDGDEWALPMIYEAMLAVGREHGPIEALVGHSLGGLATAFALARDFPARAGVMLAVTRKRRIRLEELAQRMGFDDAVVARMAALHAERFPLDDLALTIPKIAAGIRVPTLFIHSLDDERVVPEDSVAGHEATPRSELWLTRGPNHRNVARDAEAVTRMCDFLERVL